MPKLTVYDAVETSKPNISPNPARGMFGGPLGAYEVNPTMVGGVNPTVQKIRPALSVKLLVKWDQVHDSIGDKHSSDWENESQYSYAASEHTNPW